MRDNLFSIVSDFTGYFTADARLNFYFPPVSHQTSQAPVSTVTDRTTLGSCSLPLQHNVLKPFHNWQISHLALR